MGNARGREAESTELSPGQHTETMKLYHKPQRLGSSNSAAKSSLWAIGTWKEQAS